MANFETFHLKAHKESWADVIFRGEIKVTGTFTQAEWDRLSQLFAQLSRGKKLPAPQQPKQIGGRTVAEAVMRDAEKCGAIIPHKGS